MRDFGLMVVEAVAYGVFFIALLAVSIWFTNLLCDVFSNAGREE